MGQERYPSDRSTLLGTLRVRTSNREHLRGKGQDSPHSLSVGVALMPQLSLLDLNGVPCIALKRGQTMSPIGK